MTLQTPPGRDQFLFDLTRWNRAGLSRFEYLDGDAAVWLEELRIAMLGLYLHQADPEDRTPEKWRDLFLKQKSERQLKASQEEYEQALAWSILLPPMPEVVESGGKRNKRLLEQYDRHTPDDYTWEIMRAFARAAHIVLGHQNAYANEGYLGTATQWDNLRKLAAMVNYQPTPPASATTTVALEVERKDGVIEIARGLAMKYAPPAGGAPLVFEALKPVLAHADLNTVRPVNWNQNTSPLALDGVTKWTVPEKAQLAQGDVVVLEQMGGADAAATLGAVQRDLEADRADIEFGSPLGMTWQTGEAYLFTEPAAVQAGLPTTTVGHLIVKIDGAGNYPPGTIVDVTPVTPVGGAASTAVVIEGMNGFLKLHSSTTPTGEVLIEAYTPFAAGSDGKIETPPHIGGLRHRRSSGSGSPTIEGAPPSARHVNADGTGAIIARIHQAPTGSSGPGYARIAGGKADTGQVILNPPINNTPSSQTVRFEGKPPKSLQQGNWYAARAMGSNTLTPLRVLAIRAEANVYYVAFDRVTGSAHEKTDFFGPMTRTLRPVEHDRSQVDAISGGVCFLGGLSPEAQSLVKVGREIIIVYEKGGTRLAARGRLAIVEPLSTDQTALKITLESEQDFSGWQAGWTSFHLNTVDIAHGETKDPKTLGSGNAESRRQDFNFKIARVSFVPSNASMTGVAPDMDVSVDGVKWEFRDIGDPTAEGHDAWSIALNEDDTLQIHFRRRLNTGTDNIAVPRHRVGVGAIGTGVPAWSFSGPMKKNRSVTGIIQPFATAGGADREPIADIRKNAPSKLAANDRAVSLRDFERLCNRHASIWQAKAREVISPESVSRINIVIVPANGGLAGATLERDLIAFVESRALPNTKVTITNYQSLPIEMHVKIYVDPNRYEKADVKDATTTTLAQEFALVNRALGQPLYVAEILAAMERVEGVSSATVSMFGRKLGAPTPLREAVISGGLSAIFPREEQVAVIASSTDITVDVGTPT